MAATTSSDFRARARRGGAFASAPGRRLPGLLLELSKPRLSALSLLTAALAYAAARPEWALAPTLGMLVGTGLSAAGALTLNQWLERESDHLMERTRTRPLPSGQLGSGLALGWGLALSVAGPALLAWLCNALAAFLAAATIVLYVAVYTPLKRRTRFATEAGALPGALPPLLGWACAEGEIGLLGWLLFGILLFWQMPHFYAIGWTYREEYRAAGFPLLPVLDRVGGRTAGWALLYSVLLVACAAGPWALGLAGPFYGIVSSVLGAAVLAYAAAFAVFPPRRDPLARQLFYALLVYLPVVLGALVADRLLLAGA